MEQLERVRRLLQEAAQKEKGEAGRAALMEVLITVGGMMVDRANGGAIHLWRGEDRRVDDDAQRRGNTE